MGDGWFNCLAETFLSPRRGVNVLGTLQQLAVRQRAGASSERVGGPVLAVDRLCANTDPQRDSLFSKGPSDVLDHATSEIASGSKLDIDATKQLPGEGFKGAWPPLIK